MRNFSTLLSLALPLVVKAIHEVNIKNNCPLSINLYINGEFQRVLESGAVTQRHYPEGWSGFIYTDFNRGNVDGAGTVRAGFFEHYYYVVQDPNWLNVGVGIQPVNRPPVGGMCLGVTCEVFNCPAAAAFTSPPTAFPPPQAGIPPAPPLYECPVSDTGYDVTFCPSGTIPNYQTRPNPIQPIKNIEKCLDVRGGILANGTPVQIYDCNGTGAQKWVIKRGGQKIMLSGTGYCLDAGSNPANGVGMKIWQCYDNLPAQQWTYTPDNYIRLTGTSFCLDLTDGDLTNSRQAQTWTCSTGNQNQIWTI